MECVLSHIGSPPVSSPHCCSLKRRPRVVSPAVHFADAVHFAPERLLLLRDRDSSLATALCQPWLLTAVNTPKNGVIVCSGGSNDSPSPPKISSAARIRSEVISPFRTVRMFFYLAFIASGSIGALISLPRLIAALGHAPNAPPAMEVLTGLGIDLIAVLVFAILYRIDVKARDLQLAKLSREETLAGLKIELRNKKVISIGQMRGVFRLVIVAGPASHLEEACRRSEPYFAGLVERGVLVVSFATDGQVPNLQFSADNAPNIKESESGGSSNLLATEVHVEKLWRGTPIYTGEWVRWLREQKKLANVPDDSPVYLSLRLDGRVRGSGTGFPPWVAFVAQLPPLKGIWNGVLDGMDGRI